MAVIRPFRALRPTKDKVAQVAALPYDVVTTEEAKKLVKDNNYSFLHVDKPEIDFDEPVDPYDVRVYKKAGEKLSQMIKEGVYKKDKNPCIYIYQLTRDEKIQQGIVACTSIDDYVNNVIKKHENTLQAKEQDRINHVKYTKAHTGPIMMFYQEDPQISNEIKSWILNHKPIYDFVSVDNVKQTVWIVDDEATIKKLTEMFSKVSSLYIADGHHRAAAAVKVGLEMRQSNPNHTGDEEYNYFLSVIFPDKQLTIMEYNRVIKDLNGFSEKELLEKIEGNFELVYEGKDPFKPRAKHFFGMYINGKWYGLRVRENSFDENDPVGSLDVSILQNLVVSPIFGITNPREDNRIDFVGGVKGIDELARLVDSRKASIAFSLYPTPIDDLIKIADMGLIMPPKSTWFEPKLQSGIFIHSLED
ncbi:chromosome partitioning protein ParB [Tepidanaerobacter syntrophicus]|uniref:DUF1015 domain-containing protein n=1 Tax=Tepidanaerobacter syntrophicus TaxID=224999 RepID=UPI001BD1EF31|nr:DUF1015 family protein [Tepidanaerobacter syntrophicus]GLI50522.1 chromosome partitioning protein ParB [Tepidanaerobacter syntrophicus]